jgi:hypothetical protein
MQGSISFSCHSGNVLSVVIPTTTSDQVHNDIFRAICRNSGGDIAKSLTGYNVYYTAVLDYPGSVLCIIRLIAQANHNIGVAGGEYDPFNIPS